MRATSADVESARAAHSVCTLPRLRKLFDSHIFGPELMAVLDQLEVLQSKTHDLGTWLSIIAVPSAQPAGAGRGHVPRRQAYCGNHWSGNAAPSPRVIYTRRKARRW